MPKVSHPSSVRERAQLCRSVSRLALAAGILGGAVALPPTARAAALDWTGASSTDWFTGSNWSGGAAPGAGDDAAIDLISPAPVVATSNATVNSFVVGNSTSAALMISGGGSLTSAVGTLGETGGAGSMTVNGAGSQLLVQTNLNVGTGGTGSITASAGGVVTDNIGFVGENNGNGTVTIDGAGSVWNNNLAIDVGSGGTGQVTIRNGGQLNSESAILGEIGGTGSVTVDGAGSQWTNAVDIAIGSGGTGSLTIAHGGAVANINTYLGVNTNDQSSATVDGTDSFWTGTGVLTVGAAGNGTLLVSNGGTARFDSFVLADTNTSTANVTLDGGSLGATSNATDIIGNHGTATLLIKNAGVLNDIAASIGTDVGGNGTVTVDAHSSWNNSGPLAIGDAGTGTLHVINGGTVTASAIDMGLQQGASGTMTVDGVGSTVTSGAGFAVGGGAPGLIAITNGGQASGPLGIVGYLDRGTVTVDGAGSQFGGMTQGLFIGYLTGGNGAVTLSNGGQAAASAVTIADQAGSTGVLNIGAAAGSAAAAPGVVQASSLTFGAGTGTLVFNHTGANYAFAPDISGAGTIDQVAGTTFLTGDTSGFTGTANITGGALHVNGMMKNASVTVASGGTLNGNGTVGAVTAQAGAHVGPGNSIGTLTVNGNYNAAAGSIYNVELNSSGQADKLVVSGAANIASGAILTVTKLDAGDYVGGTQYTLLTAAGGVNGSFTLAGDVVQSGLLSETLAYDANDVYLRVTQTGSLSSFALTPNQKSVAASADLLPGGPMRAALFMVPDAATGRAALDASSGEIYASSRTALFEDSRFVREAALARIHTPNTGGPVVWGEGFGDWGSVDGDGNAAALNYSTTGFAGGADVPLADALRLGVVGGFSHTGMNVRQRNSAGGSDNYHLGLYGGAGEGPWTIGLGAAYSWHDVAMARGVVFGGVRDALTAQYNGGTTQAFGEAGYKTAWEGVALEPFGNIAYVNLNMSTAREFGGISALSVAGDNSGVTFTTLGVRGSQDFALGDGVLTARGGLGWRHAFGDVMPVSLASFAGGNGFAIDGAAIAEDGVAIDAGVDAALGNDLTLGLGYSGQYASGARDSGVKARFGWKF